MSLYNLLHGQNPLAPVLLGWLELEIGDVGRFRDVYLTSEPHIVVFTRNGGGNREDYADVTERLQAHPMYVRDWDDDFDCTYASYEFRVPPVWLEAAKALADDSPPPMEKMANLIAKLQSAPKDDPEVVRVLDKMRPTMDAIAAALVPVVPPSVREPK